MRSDRARRHQPAIINAKGQRVARLPVGAAVEGRIEAWIAGQQRRFKVSRSFVIAVALADAAGVTLHGTYRYDTGETR